MKNIDLLGVVNNSIKNYKIRFNNNLTRRTILNAIKNELIIFTHFQSPKKALQAAKRIKRYNLKEGLSRVCIWCTPESRKQFRKRITKEYNLNQWKFFTVSDFMPLTKILSKEPENG